MTLTLCSRTSVFGYRRELDYNSWKLQHREHPDGRIYLSDIDKFVGLERAASGEMTAEGAQKWIKIKRGGKAYFKSNPLRYGVFDQRPLPELARRYAGQDTIVMPILFRVYLKRMANYPCRMGMVRWDRDSEYLKASERNMCQLVNTKCSRRVRFRLF